MDLKEVFTYQYDLLKGSRNVLLDFCSSMKNEDLIFKFENFGRGSIRNLLVHIADTYRFWLKDFAEQTKSVYAEYEFFTNVNKIKNHFEETDELVMGFLANFKNNFNQSLTGHVLGKEITAEPLKLFTHVLTHEYHHKGQILSMGRNLGYIPPDTDALR